MRDIGGVNRGPAWQLYNRDMYCHKDDSNSVLDALSSFYVLIVCLYACTLYDIFIINTFFPSKTTITVPQTCVHSFQTAF